MSNSNANSEPFFTWEAFLLGGLSITVCLACWLFIDKGTSLTTMSQAAFTLAFVINHPHFLSSYILLYGDFGKKINTNAKYFWAAVVAPVAIASALVYGIAVQDSVMMGYVINAMYFLVGWHYIKQIFGCVIVTSARRKMFFSQLERRALLTNLLSLWALSFFGSQVGAQSFEFYGIRYYNLGLPFFVREYTFYAVALTGAFVFYLGVKKYIREGRVVNSSALMALGALYVWYLPVFSHPHFGYLIPLFHSLQYLVFVWSFKKNQVSDKIRSLKGAEMRQAWLQKFAGFLVSATVLGALAFEFDPRWLDGQQFIAASTIGTSPFMAAILLFINIHHYFIDNVIWRSQNEEIKKYLFAPEAQQAEGLKRVA